MLGLALVSRVAIACSMAMLSNGASGEFIPVERRASVMTALAFTGRLCLQGAPFMNSLVKMKSFFINCKFSYFLNVSRQNTRTASL
jgi:hypothetical protein